MNTPRNHHFVPQFWIKRFVSADGKLWAYDWDDDDVKPRSSKGLMQLRNLYTVEPTGIDDTTLETDELGKFDREGNAVFDRVLGGDRSEAAKEEFATFLAAQIFRDPVAVASYNPKAQDMALSLLTIFDAPDYATFAKAWSKTYDYATITEHEYNHIHSLGLQGAETDIDNIIAALDAPGGMPDLPFTDLIRSADGREIICDQLLKLDWTLKSDTNAGFVLGDSGVLYDKDHLVGGLRAPLSQTNALYLTPSERLACDIQCATASSYEVENLNLESAARARRWLVGDKSTLGRLKSQLTNENFPRI